MEQNATFLYFSKLVPKEIAHAFYIKFVYFWKIHSLKLQ